MRTRGPQLTNGRWAESGILGASAPAEWGAFPSIPTTPWYAPLNIHRANEASKSNPHCIMSSSASYTSSSSSTNSHITISSELLEHDPYRTPSPSPPNVPFIASALLAAPSRPQVNYLFRLYAWNSISDPPYLPSIDDVGDDIADVDDAPRQIALRPRFDCINPLQGL